ncbi:hypothetical protein EG327_010308 [Venturia inaequalis]|uniref:Uncharacterized protein n=1 Tax=Venturia inaequalis TaxID=5025 RepID=A0A8H3UJH0_VENIN|nr:hypothetical protein EG327_010308 [Venturia inaequalis]
MHAPLSCLLLSTLVLSHSASSKALSKRNDPTYINRIGLGRVRLNVCSEINYKKCFLGWDPNISYFDHADSIICYDVQRIFSIKSIEIPYGVTCDLYSVFGCNDFKGSTQPPIHKSYKGDSQADLRPAFDKHGGQSVKSLKCQFTGGKIPDPLPQESYAEPVAGNFVAPAKCISPSPWEDCWLHQH